LFTLETFVYIEKNPRFTAFLDSNLHTRLVIITENELGLAFPPRNLPKKICLDLSTFYLVIVVINKQTDRQTNAGDSIIPRFRGYNNTHTCAHTHPFNGPLSGTTRVSQYQKGKINLDFTEARDSECCMASAGSYASLHLAPHRQPCQHPTAQFFYKPDALPAAQPTVSKHLKHVYKINIH